MRSLMIAFLVGAVAAVGALYYFNLLNLNQVSGETVALSPPGGGYLVCPEKGGFGNFDYAEYEPVGESITCNYRRGLPATFPKPESGEKCDTVGHHWEDERDDNITTEECHSDRLNCIFACYPPTE